MLPEAQKEILFRRQDLRQLGKTENRINMWPGMVGATTQTSGNRAGFPTGRMGNGYRQALMEVNTLLYIISFLDNRSWQLF